MLLNSLRLTARCLQHSYPIKGISLGTAAQVQKYSNWVHRQPSRIVTEEEILEKIEEAEGPNEFLETEKRRPLKVRPNKFKPLKKKKVVVTPVDKPYKEDGQLNFTELKENDPQLTSLMMSVRSRKMRDRNSRIILEGHRLIADAIAAGATPEVVVFSRVADARRVPLPKDGVKLYKTPYRAIQTWTTLTTAPGIMAFFKIPDVESIAPPPDAIPLTIICDNVREPGNLGSILRACAAVGCKQLILTKGCVDLWDSKVLRSAAGAHFRMPIYATKTWDEVRRMIDPSAYVYVADHNAVVSEEFAKEGEEPSQGEEEVILIDEDSEKAVENLKKTNSSHIEDFESEDDFYKSVVENTTDVKSHREQQRDAKLAQKLVTNIPISPYYSTDYTDLENVIIMGGETEGISLEALALVHERSGIRINIPMTNGVDSLNTGMALGIVAFEIRRQFSLKNKVNNFDDKTEDN